jgi:hypothetical protein
MLKLPQPQVHGQQSFAVSAARFGARLRKLERLLSVNSDAGGSPEEKLRKKRCS